jgi:hypothetical protein
MCALHHGLCRGKLLNVRDASATQISGNAEIQNIKQILGLQHGKVGGSWYWQQTQALLTLSAYLSACTGV